jgi:hypothetical protein
MSSSCICHVHVHVLAYVSSPKVFLVVHIHAYMIYTPCNSGTQISTYIYAHLYSIRLTVCVSPLFAIIALNYDNSDIHIIMLCICCLLHTDTLVCCVSILLSQITATNCLIWIKVHLRGCCVHCTVYHLYASQIMFVALNIYSTHHCIFLNL